MYYFLTCLGCVTWQILETSLFVNESLWIWDIICMLQPQWHGLCVLPLRALPCKSPHSWSGQDLDLTLWCRAPPPAVGALNTPPPFKVRAVTTVPASLPALAHHVLLSLGLGWSLGCQGLFLPIYSCGSVWLFFVSRSSWHVDVPDGKEWRERSKEKSLWRREEWQWRACGKESL